ncbi:hypothetical protein B6U93_03045 [Candidatus Woesearchaeota archaeon ex4484_78]|nr:MAG: hypothetical protein B6U93_03045 [Candidatus Woesearchaeota archaeon ex4484_78]
MHPEIVFLGTAGSKSVIGKRSGAGTLIKSDSFVLVDPGPGSLVDFVRAGFNPEKLSAVIVSKDDVIRNYDVSAFVWASGVFDKKDFVLDQNNFTNIRQFGDLVVKPVKLKDSLAVLFRFPDCSVLYSPVCARLPQADVVILAGRPDKKCIDKLGCKLVVLTHFESFDEDVFYLARELSDKVKVISAEDGLVVSPLDYSAVDSQKSLLKFK